MAQLIGGITTSHVPAIGRAIARDLQADPYWKPFFDGYPPVHDWLAKVKPDVVVMFYNDHGLNFFLDKMPTFAVGAAAEYRNADEGWGIPVVPPFQGEQDLSWHLIESLTGDDFDLTTCQEMLVDHAFTLPMALLWPGRQDWPVKVVPVCINTGQFPLPSARRCWQLGQAIGRAIRSWDSEQRVVVVGTGGLSHQLDGERAGFINKDFDHEVHGQPARRPGLGHQVLDHRPGRAERHARHRDADVAGHARGVGQHGAQGARRLPYTSLQYRRRDDGA